VKHKKERALSKVPGAVLCALLACLVAQAAMKTSHPPSPPRAEDLPIPPAVAVLRLASLGDPVPFAKGMMLYLQAFDYHAGNQLPYQKMDYTRLIGWLSAVLELDPAGQYPLHAASRIYAEVPDPEKQRLMLNFVYEQFLRDPGRRWPWLAHAAVVAKHQLKDLPLARRYAAAIQQHATGENVPMWARQMEIFILEEMNELETARVMIGGLVQSGRITHPGELRFLEEKLKSVEGRLQDARSE
jgi:hypothetical protein